jgi:hypothetical protein
MPSRRFPPPWFDELLPQCRARRFSIAPCRFMADGKPGPAIELRDLFPQFLNEVEGNK